MIRKILALFYTDTGKDTGIVFAGTLVNVVTAGLFFILAPRILGPENYGIFAMVMATGILATNVANLGLDTGILRFATQAENFNRVLSLAFKIYLVLGGTVFIVGFLISPFIARFLEQESATRLLQIAFSGAIFLLLTSFFVASLQAKRQFIKASLVNISSNIARVIILAVAAYFFTADLYFITLLFFFVPIISVIFGKVFLPVNLEPIDKEIAKKFLKYNFWIAAAFALSSVPFENYFLLKVAGPVQAGFYAAPFKILTFVHQFAGNFSRVLASRFASFDTDLKTIDFVKKAIGIILIFSVLLFILFLLTPFITELLFGKEFSESQPVFKVLIFAFIFFFATTLPSSIILYYFGKSHVTFIITILRVTILVLMLILLVERYQALGAAFALLIAETFILVVSSAYCMIKLKK